ncbi:dienelactone hydrolase family protein [Geitlerinema sp. PCC 7407]|uniref:dienelactone hydrolase family protein n=1 Tax=Geitlerinema sp. PCC 7407 TaxID=1173025 RepID=UPI00029FFB64|nr:dienelactone hydrolase family protein [Geitlerinema sp. PCC 7407]AFY64804.1 dienelactone hydrolase family protein [Geitlerinema sp. PCC 7407]
MAADIRTETVTVPGEVAIAAYLAEPVGPGPFPAVVVLQEIFGVNAHIREVTERLARLGYVAIAPALYQRLAPGFEAGYTPQDIQVGREYKNQTRAPELLSDIQSTLTYLQQKPNVRAQALGAIGFCFGGHVAYLAATLPAIRATASFYGAGIPDWCPGEAQPTLQRTAQISGTLYAFFGMEDQSIPEAHVNQIESSLAQHGVKHRVFRYAGAGHGFFCDRRQSYESRAAADAWEQVQRLFQGVLQGD